MNVRILIMLDHTHTFATSVVSSLQQTPDFTADSKIALVGLATKPSHWDENNFFVYQLMGASGLSPTVYSAPEFFSYYCGIPLNFASNQEIAQIVQTPEFSEMAVYPGYGSIRKIGDIFVIKISEVAEGTLYLVHP